MIFNINYFLFSGKVRSKKFKNFDRTLILKFL
ncbi:unknown [[Mannheimia] succiniciproducens MBEL55E]|uniref:Uncharacterized protein n=1 Tax=Mannheimia succiniciproducens (strain KCTC 0769BP / MBEL55E) TaxID=221988 RepID=Q65TH3_MANSM|nr:unknown [[Mannheimia] succiniciproducens MBEL55E]